MINGITLGGLYALIALGYTMVYGVIQLINFAHGEFFAAGGYMGVILLSFFTGLGYMDTHPILCLAASFVLTMGYCAFLAVVSRKWPTSPCAASRAWPYCSPPWGCPSFCKTG